MSNESPEFRPFETRLKIGQKVRVQRTNGEIEEDWHIHLLEQLDVHHNGKLEDVAVCIKDTPDGPIRRIILIGELERLNP